MHQYAGLDFTFDLCSCTVLFPVRQNQLHLAPKRAVGWEFQVVVGSLRQTRAHTATMSHLCGQERSCPLHIFVHKVAVGILACRDEQCLYGCIVANL